MSNQQPSTEEHNRGWGVGCEWARSRATEFELRYLRLAVEDEDLWWAGKPYDLGWAGAVLGSIRPHGAAEMSEADVAEFWAGLDVEDPSKDWLRGFVDGACEVAYS